MVRRAACAMKLVATRLLRSVLSMLHWPTDDPGAGSGGVEIELRSGKVSLAPLNTMRGVLTVMTFGCNPAQGPPSMLIYVRKYDCGQGECVVVV